MSSIQIQIPKQVYRPREVLRGKAEWGELVASGSIELRLCWVSCAFGEPSVYVVDRLVFQKPLSHQSRTFEFRLPFGPFSYRGNNSHLYWLLELVLLPANTSHRLQFDISPVEEVLNFDQTDALTR